MTVHAAWVDEGEIRYLAVDIAPGVRWEAHTGSGDLPDQIDGHLVGGRGLDLWAVDGVGTNDLRDDPTVPNIVQRAHDTWDAGSVLCIEYGVKALILPFTSLDEHVVAEAFRRFRP